MKLIHKMMLLSIVVLASCQSNQKEVTKDSTENPLLSEWNTPFGVPPFDQIKNEHYKPAFETALKEHKAEIDAIANNNETPTFENTIVALELSGASLTKVASVFYAVNSANTNDEIEHFAGNYQNSSNYIADMSSGLTNMTIKIKNIIENNKPPSGSESGFL